MTGPSTGPVPGPRRAPAAGGVRPRLAVISPYWRFFEDSVGGAGFRDDRTRLIDRCRTVLEPHGEIVLAEMTDPDVDVALLAERIRVQRAEVLLLVITMAAPSAATLDLIDALPAIPVVLWAAVDGTGLVANFTHADITRRGATVGTPMITSMLVRTGRPFDLVSGPLDHPLTAESLARAVLAAGAAARIRGARIGRIGDPIPGYRSVDTPDDLLSGTVDEVRRIDPKTFARAYTAVSPAAVRAWKAEHTSTYRWASELDELHGMAIAAGLALHRIVDDEALNAGTMNCHLPEIRGAEGLGFAPCFALGAATSAGVPFSCTGDVLTALAMLTTKLLTGTSIYHEIEAHDGDADDFVIANSGEHDAAFSDGPLTVGINPWWPQGVCAKGPVPAGPATLLACCQIGTGGYRFIVAEGTFSGAEIAGAGTVSGRFHFSTTPGERAWAAWCRAGAGHHSAAAAGTLGAAVESVGRHLGIEVVGV